MHGIRGKDPSAEMRSSRPGYYRTTEVKRLEGLETALGISAEDWSDREGFEASYQPKRVLSGTGAGDTTIAAFLTAMLEGYPFKCVSIWQRQKGPPVWRLMTHWAESGRLRNWRPGLKRDGKNRISEDKEHGKC